MNEEKEKYKYTEVIAGPHSNTGTGLTIYTETNEDEKNGMIILTATVRIKGKRQRELHERVTKKCKINPIFHYLRRYQDTPRKNRSTEASWLRIFDI